jgi:multiple sugar transport system substrate-binding protein
MRGDLSRRTFLGGSAVAGTGLLLAACGAVSTAPAADAPASSDAPAEEKKTEAPAPAEAKIVKYLHVTTNQAVWDESFGAFFDAFGERYPEYDLQVDPTVCCFAETIDKALASFAGGISYDVYYGHFSYISQFATAEMIQSLEPFLSADAEVSKEDYHVWATERIQGQVYSIAWFTNGKEYWYNADLYAEAGLKTPKEHEAEGTWTWDTLLEGAKKLTKTEGNNVTQWGFWTPSYSFGWHWIHLMAYGATWWNEDFSAPSMLTQEFAEGTQFAADLVTKHRVMQSRAAPSENDVANDFNTQLLAGRTWGSYGTRTIEEQIMSQDEPFTVEMEMLPKGPAGRQVVQSINANWISSSSENPEGAWDFYKFWLSQEGQSFIVPLGGGRYVSNKNFQGFTVYDYEDPEVYARSAEISVEQRQVVKQSDVNNAWTENWEALELETKTVQEVQEEMQRVAENALQEGGCLC